MGYDDSLRPALLRDLVAQEQVARNTAGGYSISAYDPEAAFDSVTEALPIPTRNKAAPNRPQTSERRFDPL